MNFWLWRRTGLRRRLEVLVGEHGDVVAADSAAASGSAGAAPHPTPPAASVADRPGANDSRPPPGRVAAEAGVSSEVRRPVTAYRDTG